MLRKLVLVVSLALCAALLTGRAAAVIRIDTVNTYNNIASDVHFYDQGSGPSQWTDTLRNEVYAAFSVLGGPGGVYTKTPKQYNFYWAATVNGSQPTTIIPKTTYAFNGDNFDYFYCNNPATRLGAPLLCYPGLTAEYMTNAGDVAYHFVGYDIYLASSYGLNASFYSVAPTANLYYFRGAIMEALLWTAGLGGTLPTTAVGNSGVPQRLSSANCPLCISQYDSSLQFANGTYLFNTNTRPLTPGALALLYGAITSNSLVISFTPKADEPDTTAVVYTQPGLYYPGWTLYTWSTNPLRSPGVGPNPGGVPFLTDGNNAIGLVGASIVPVTSGFLSPIETYLLRANGLYSYTCGTAATCGQCNALAGCGWCERSSFCVDTLAGQACPDASEVPNADSPCNVCTASADCNPVGVHPSCYTATCVQNRCNVTLLPTTTSCIVGGNACNLGTCSTTGTCVVSGICNDGKSCTTDACALVMGVPTCSHTPVVPSTSCGTCAVAGDCTAPPFPGCVNTTCQAGQCVYAPLTGHACGLGNSCFTNGTCAADGSCTPASSYLTNGTAFSCPTVPNACYHLNCVGTGPSPVCTTVPIAAPSACFTCNNATGVFTENTCPTAPAGQTGFCAINGAAPECINTTLGCSADADCASVCGTAAVCTGHKCRDGTCVCDVPVVCQDKCFGCSAITGLCGLLSTSSNAVNECGTCGPGNPCCAHPDCDGAKLVNSLAPVGAKREIDFVLSDDDNDELPSNTIIENGVQVVCLTGAPNLCQYTFVVYFSDGADDDDDDHHGSVIISDPANNFITFDGQLQPTRSPPQTIDPRTENSRGTVYRLTTLCSTDVTWSLFAFGRWLNISSGGAGRTLVDACGVCGGDGQCAGCNANGNQCIGCGCSAPLLACRAQDALACHATSPCTYPTCNVTLDISDMCIDNLQPAGTPCSHRGHDGSCNAEGTCEFFDSWSSSSMSSSYPYEYSSLDQPLNNSDGTQAGLVLLPTAVALIMGAAFIALIFINANAPVTLFVHLGNGEWQYQTVYPSELSGEQPVYVALGGGGGEEEAEQFGSEFEYNSPTMGGRSAPY